MTADPFATYLRQAEDLHAQGQLVKAGQIWQAILKQQPSHQIARECLLRLKQQLLALREQEEASAAAQPPAATTPVLEPPAAPEARAVPPATKTDDPVPTEPPPSKATEASDPERLMAEGCTLYDMGQLPDALKKWEQVLTQNPAHLLARSYASGVRRELGLPPLEALVAPEVVIATHIAPEEDLDKLLREAVQLYDMGLVEDAISKWERVLVLEPQRKEVEDYLREARKELGQKLQSPTPASTESLSDAGGLELKLRQAEHLMALQRHEEAAFTFQQALSISPGHPGALAGLERCRKPTSSATAPPSLTTPRAISTVDLDAQGRIAMAIVSEGTLGQEPKAVEPPASLREGKSPLRKGLDMPKGFGEVLERLPWLKEPRVLAGIGGTLLVLAVSLFLFRGHIRDQELQRAVKAAKAAALEPLNQQTQIHDLSETPEAIRQEAQAALDIDPLHAYLRAETLVARAPGDAAAAQLLEKARVGLPGGVAGASLAEFQKHLQNGDLEAAAKVVDALLRATPDDASIRVRAARLDLLLCNAHVGQGKWDAAYEDLRRGRALFPEDKSWQARIYLLERVKAMPKHQQPGWIPLLG
jgi:tetratricopeptide (TPR) repeat protein